jgi:hypothetical protein
MFIHRAGYHLHLGVLLAWPLGILLASMLLLSLLVFLLRCLDQWRLFHQPHVLLEVTPPAQRNKSPLATERLFSVLHSLETTRSWSDRLLRRRIVLALELVSTRSEGIRFVIRVAESNMNVCKQHLLAYLPDAAITQTSDYFATTWYTGHLRCLSFKQVGHYAYPLQAGTSLSQHDPVAYITESMTKLATDELMVFQLVLSPEQVRGQKRIEAALQSGKVLHRTLGNSGLQGALARMFTTIGRAIQYTVRCFVVGWVAGHDKVTTPSLESHTFSQKEQELTSLVQAKLAQPLFRVDIRALTITTSLQATEERSRCLTTALSGFTFAPYQALKRQGNLPLLKDRYRWFLLRSRLPALRSSQSSILSASEVAALYHFPHTKSAQTENIVRSLSRSLPAPVSLKTGLKPDILLGWNNHHETSTDIGLTAAERERHVYIVGGTGNGKTTMLQYMAVQDMHNGRGVAIVDPHGDFAESLLRHVPKKRLNDVIYLNPYDLAYPIGINLLELPTGLSINSLLLEKDLVTESIVSIFRKLFSAEAEGGHRIEYILRNAIHTAFTIEDATLFTVLKLLSNVSYRRQVVNKLDDQDLKDFWKNELDKAGDYQRVKLSIGVTAKISRFQRSVVARRILEQPVSTINFDSLLDSGKILICNFSKGKLGEDTAALFGCTVMAKLQMAAMRRARQPQANRKPFYVYVDEFQSFATTSFVEMLNEARKYKLLLTMAEQSTSQQAEQRLVRTILANVGTVVCFRTGSPADEDLLLPLFRPYLEEGEIASLPAFHFYTRISGLRPQEPLSGETSLLEDEGSSMIAKEVIARSRRLYAHPYRAPKQPVIIKQPEKIPSKQFARYSVPTS